MVSSVYRNAYKEAYIILSYLEIDEYNKIPPEVINAIKNNMNDEYEYYMNEEVDLFNQTMMEETKAILFNLFRDYLSTPEQKEKIIRMQEEDRIKLEKKKQKKYGVDMFENTRDKEEVTREVDKKDLPLLIENKTLFKRIIDFLKNIF